MRSKLNILIGLCILELLFNFFTVIRFRNPSFHAVTAERFILSDRGGPRGGVAARDGKAALFIVDQNGLLTWRDGK